MSGLNKVMLIGHLGQDPETKYIPSGDAVTNISVATSEQWTDKKTGEKQERTEWHRIVMWRRLAEIAAEFLHKGSHVYIEGKLQTRKWEDKEGVTRYTTEIVADRMQMLGGKRDGERSGASEAGSARVKPESQSRPTPDDFDDDIPF